MPTWLPPGAIGHSDYIAAQHFWGGAERSIGDVLGGDFDSGSLSSEGMRIEASSGGNKPQAIGSMLVPLLGNFIAVVEYKPDNPNDGSNTLIGVYDSASRDGGFEAYFSRSSSFDTITGSANAFTASGSGNADEEESAGNSSDVIKSVFINDVGMVAVSSQGHQLVAGNHSLTLPTRTIAYIGHVGEGADGALTGWLRKLTLYPAPTAL